MANQQIQDYVAQGCVFHGSIRDDIAVLIPSDPRDAGDDPWNKEVAVYATDDVAGAIAFSLIKGFRGTFEVNRSEDGVTVAIFPRTFSERLSSNVGSLYVLRRDDFPVFRGWQYKSYNPVKPIARIDVTLQDYLDFGGQIVYR